VIRLRVEDGAHRVAHAGRRVKVDEAGPTAGLRKAVGHSDDDRLLQAEDVAEIVGKVRQHRQLGRPRVAEDRRDAVLAQQVERGIPDGGHCAAALYASRTIAGRRARVIVAAVRSATPATRESGTRSLVTCATAPPPAVPIVWAEAHARFMSANA
jgi:hypothetical protein